MGQTKQSYRRHQAPVRHLRQGLGCSWPLTPWTGSSPVQSTPASRTTQEEHPACPPAALPGEGGSPISVSLSPSQTLLSSNSREIDTPCHLYDEEMPPNLTLIYYSFHFTKNAQRAVIKGSRVLFPKSLPRIWSSPSLPPSPQPHAANPQAANPTGTVPSARQPCQRGGGGQWGCPSSILCPFWISWFYFYFRSHAFLSEAHRRPTHLL